MTPAAHAALPTVERGSVAPTLLTGLALAALSGTAAMVTSGDAPLDHAGPRLILPVLGPASVLVVGLWGPARARAGLLLCGVPAAVALAGLARTSAPVDPIVLAVTAAILLGYLIAALRLLDAAPQAGARVDVRAVEPLPARMRRRLRLYRLFRVCAALGFVAPLGAAVHAIAVENAAHPLLLVAAAGLLGALSSRAFLVDALERHLQRDVAVLASLSRLRRHARRGRPATSFYVAAGLALVTMMAFALRQRLGLAGVGP